MARHTRCSGVLEDLLSNASNAVTAGAPLLALLGVWINGRVWDAEKTLQAKMEDKVDKAKDELKSDISKSLDAALLGLKDLKEEIKSNSNEQAARIEKALAELKVGGQALHQKVEKAMDMQHQQGQANTARVEKALAELKADGDALQRKMDQQGQTATARMEQALADLKAKGNASEAKEEALDHKVKDHAGRLATLETKISKVETKVSKVETDVQAINSNILKMLDETAIAKDGLEMVSVREWRAVRRPRRSVSRFMPRNSDSAASPADPND